MTQQLNANKTMSKAQVWTTIVLTFLLLLVTVTGAYALGISHSLERILSAPASTAEFDADVDFSLTAGANGEWLLQEIHFNRVSGKFNSKIVDLILLAASN